MQTEVLLPELGTDPAEPVRLSAWFAEEGDRVYEGDCLVEVLVSGATIDVPAPSTGVLRELMAYPDDFLQPGQVLGLIDVDENGP